MSRPAIIKQEEARKRARKSRDLALKFIERHAEYERAVVGEMAAPNEAKSLSLAALDLIRSISPWRWEIR